MCGIAESLPHARLVFHKPVAGVCHEASRRPVVLDVAGNAAHTVHDNRAQALELSQFVQIVAPDPDASKYSHCSFVFCVKARGLRSPTTRRHTLIYPPSVHRLTLPALLVCQIYRRSFVCPSCLSARANWQPPAFSVTLLLPRNPW